MTVSKWKKKKKQKTKGGIRGKAINPSILYHKAKKPEPRLRVKEVYLMLKKENKKPISYQIMAERIGMKNPNNIAKWMNDQNLTFKTLKIIAIAMEVPVKLLIHE